MKVLTLVAMVVSVLLGLYGLSASNPTFAKDKTDAPLLAAAIVFAGSMIARAVIDSDRKRDLT